MSGARRLLLPLSLRPLMRSAPTSSSGSSRFSTLRNCISWFGLLRRSFRAVADRSRHALFNIWENDMSEGKTPAANYPTILAFIAQCVDARQLRTVIENARKRGQTPVAD